MFIIHRNICLIVSSEEGACESTTSDSDPQSAAEELLSTEAHAIVSIATSVPAGIRHEFGTVVSCANVNHGHHKSWPSSLDDPCQRIQQCTSSSPVNILQITLNLRADTPGVPQTSSQTDKTGSATSKTGTELQDVSAVLESSSSAGDRATASSNEEVRRGNVFTDMLCPGRVSGRIH